MDGVHVLPNQRARCPVCRQYVPRAVCLDNGWLLAACDDCGTLPIDGVEQIECPVTEAMIRELEVLDNPERPALVKERATLEDILAFRQALAIAREYAGTYAAIARDMCVTPEALTNLLGAVRNGGPGCTSADRVRKWTHMLDEYIKCKEYGLEYQEAQDG